ncbi:hypothetical protein AB7942_08080 [Neobacillus sp. BF23-41]|uniref:hypothetical protein n=1 Tax=Neobacillus sp. BF23-41 TaxID=3240280 RepID=UPI0034E5E149
MSDDDESWKGFWNDEYGLSELEDSVAPVDSEIAIKRIEEEMSGKVSNLFASFTQAPLPRFSWRYDTKGLLGSIDE